MQATDAETLVLHSRPIGFYVRDPQCDTTVWIGNLAATLGLESAPEPQTFEEWFALIHPDDRSQVKQRLADFLSRRDPLHLCYRVRNHSGDYVSICDDAVFLSQERVVGVVTPSDTVTITEDLFSQFVGGTALGVLLLDEDRRVLYANASAGATFGIEPTDLRGTAVEERIPGIWDRVDVPAAGGGDSASRSLKLLRTELVGRKSDGTRVPMAVGLNSLQLGDTAGCVCTLLDLSELKRRERDAERFFELSVDLLCIADGDGRFTRVNPSFTRVLGFSEEELLSTPFINFVHPEDRPATMDAVMQLASGQPVVEFRNRYRKREGGYCWLEWTAQPVKESATIYAIARDVTARFLMEESLRVHEVRERAILNNTVSVIYVKDMHGRYEFVNRQFLDLFRLTKDDVISHTDHDIFPEEIAQQFWSNDRRVLDTGDTLNIEETAPHPDGLHTYLSVKVPLRDAQGRVMGMAGISTDITDRMRASATVQELRFAQQVQRKLYPDSAPDIAGLDVAGLARPVAQLCGDYYDFLVRPNGNLAVIVGDVSGHGFGPALGMVQTRSLLRMLLHSSESLDHALQRINELLCCDLPEGTFVSLFVAEINADTGDVTYGGAGHDAWILRTNGDVQHLESTGMVLGLMDDETFGVAAVRPLCSGDALLLVTDGVFEAMSPLRESFGKHRIKVVVRQMLHESADKILTGLFESVDVFTQACIRDDMTAVLVKRHT